MQDRKPPIVILSGIRWEFLWQRHQILATHFAQAGYKTIFVETTGLATPRPDRNTLCKIFGRLSRSGGKGKKTPHQPNLTVYSPLTAPPTWKAFRHLNRRVFAPRVGRDLRRIAGDAPIVIAYPPTRTTLDLISEIRPRLLYYDCSEDYEGFPNIPADISATERSLLLDADLVSCTSPTLLDKAQRLRPDAFLSGPSVTMEQFASLQEDPAGEPQRTVCYFGHVGRERINLGVFRTLAQAGYQVRIVGEVGRAERELIDVPGIDYRREVPHEELPAALSGVDVFLLPYLDNKLTRGISPAKTFECLATGKPVVASPLPALKSLGDHLYLAQEPEEFVNVLQNLDNLESKEKIRTRIQVARENSWEARFAVIEKKLWETIQNA
ncbi:glycosyltransferase family 1 protein [soil metagenome]